MGIPDSAIASASYDPRTGRLTIEFQHGGSYLYTVPPDVYAGLVLGGGEFFNHAIRDVFPEQRGNSSGALEILEYAAEAIEVLGEL